VTDGELDARGDDDAGLSAWPLLALHPPASTSAPAAAAVRTGRPGRANPSTKRHLPGGDRYMADISPVKTGSTGMRGKARVPSRTLPTL
jgi:hypothetical protein